MPIIIEGKRVSAVDAAEAASPSRAATKRFRAENLSDDDPREQHGNHLVEPHARVIWHAGYEVERARHQILGQLYALMGILGENLELSGSPEEEQTIVQILHPFLVADAELAPTFGNALGTARYDGRDLHQLQRIKRRLQYRASRAD
jgi:hypothetical protein